AATRLSLDGIPLVHAKLDAARRTGSVASVGGSLDGRVSTLDFERIAAGTIQAVDVAHARIEILGQRVYVTGSTNIDGGSALDQLRTGDYVSISGYFGPDGDQIATAIYRETSSTTFLLRGILELVAGGSVRVGGQTLGQLSDITVTDFPAAPASGD